VVKQDSTNECSEWEKYCFDTPCNQLSFHV